MAPADLALVFEPGLALLDVEGVLLSHMQWYMGTHTQTCLAGVDNLARDRIAGHGTFDPCSRVVTQLGVTVNPPDSATLSSISHMDMELYLRPDVPASKKRAGRKSPALAHNDRRGDQGSVSAQREVSPVSNPSANRLGSPSKAPMSQIELPLSSPSSGRGTPL